MNYYNDNDPGAAAWLRELIADGLIPAGDVDETSILEINPASLHGYTQLHFFAGIGGWPFALRLTGWPDSRPVITGSCPCQPLSSAGRQRAHADQRHLWPAFQRILAECRAPTIFGEQVASKLGREWLAGVRADLEGMGYAVGAADLCAAGVGSPQRRQRLFWVAHANRARCHGKIDGTEGEARDEARMQLPCADRPTGGVGESEGEQPHGKRNPRKRRGESSDHGGLGDAIQPGLERHAGNGNDRDQSGRLPAQAPRSIAEAGPSGFWSRAEWHPCADGKARRIEPGVFPLAQRLPGRVGLLRGSGNAIVPQIAAEFVKAYLESPAVSR